MALKPILETLDSVDAAYHPLYIKADDGKFYLEVEGLPEMRDGLKRANAESMQRRKELEKFKDMDPARYAEAIQKLEALETKDAEAKGQWEQLKTQMATNHKTELERLQSTFSTREKKLMTTLEQRLVDAEAIAAIVAEEGSVDLMLPIVKGRLKVAEDDSGFKVNVLNQDGAVGVDASGNPLSIASLVKSMKAEPKYMPAFKGVNASGGGAPQGRPNMPGSFNLTRAQAKDPNTYRQAKDAAEKAGSTVTITD